MPGCWSSVSHTPVTWQGGVLVHLGVSLTGSCGYFLEGLAEEESPSQSGADVRSEGKQGCFCPSLSLSKREGTYPVAATVSTVLQWRQNPASSASDVG